VWTSLVVVRYPFKKDAPEMALAHGIKKSRHSRRIVPTSRSHTAFACGDPKGVRSTFTPIVVTAASKSLE
jgi:hypothetical protein